MPPLDTCEKSLRPFSGSQLLEQISSGHLNADNEKKQQKMTDFFLKMGLEPTYGEFLGMYKLDFSRSSIFHQLWAHIGYFEGKKMDRFFTPFHPFFLCQADFRKL